MVENVRWASSCWACAQIILKLFRPKITRYTICQVGLHRNVIFMLLHVCGSGHDSGDVVDGMSPMYSKFTHKAIHES